MSLAGDVQGPGARRAALRSLGLAVRREAHVLVGSDVERLPQLVWQQLSGRLRPDTEGDLVLDRLLREEEERRSAPDAPPWLRVVMAPPETSALIGTLEGHEDWVTDCATTATGGIVSSGRDGRLLVWTLDPLRRLHALEGHEGWVNACAATPAGDLAVSVGEDGVVRRWDLRSMRPAGTIRIGDGYLNACALSADGTLVAAGGEDGSVSVASVEDGSRPERIALHSAEVMDVAWSPRPGTLASTGADGAVLLCVVGGDPLPLEHAGTVASCAFSPDGRWLASAGWDGEIRMWSVEEGQATPDTTVAVEGAATRCAFSPDGAWLAVGDDRALVHLFDVLDPSTHLVLPGHGGPVTGLAFSATSDRLVSASRDRTLKVWDRSAASPDGAGEAFVRRVASCGFDAAGSRLMTGDVAGTIEIWDVGSGARLDSRSTGDDPVVGCGFDADGGTAFLARGSRGVMWSPVTSAAFDPRTGRDALGTSKGEIELGGSTFAIHGWDVLSIALDPHGWFGASGDSAGHVRVWEMGSGRVLAELEGHEAPVEACATAADGTTLASGDRIGSVILWHWPEHSATFRLREHTGAVAALAFTPEGAFLVSAGEDRRIVLWNVLGGSSVAMLPTDSAPTCLALSPDGRHLAIGLERGFVVAELVGLDGEGAWRAVAALPLAEMATGISALRATHRPNLLRALLDHLERAYEAAHDDAGIAACLGWRAVAHGERGEFDLALPLHERQAQIYRETGDRRELTIALFNQAVAIARSRGPLAEAIRRAETAREAASACGAGDMQEHCDSFLEWARASLREGG